MELSYAQNLEDYHLPLAFADRPPGTYIESAPGSPMRTMCPFWFINATGTALESSHSPNLRAVHPPHPAQNRPPPPTRRNFSCSISLVLLVLTPLLLNHFYVCGSSHGPPTTVEYLAQKAKAFGFD